MHNVNVNGSFFLPLLLGYTFLQKNDMTWHHFTQTKSYSKRMQIHDVVQSRIRHQKLHVPHIPSCTKPCKQSYQWHNRPLLSLKSKQTESDVLACEKAKLISSMSNHITALQLKCALCLFCPFLVPASRVSVGLCQPQVWCWITVNLLFFPYCSIPS